MSKFAACANKFTHNNANHKMRPLVPPTQPQRKKRFSLVDNVLSQTGDDCGVTVEHIGDEIELSYAHAHDVDDDCQLQQFINPICMTVEEIEAVPEPTPTRQPIVLQRPPLKKKHSLMRTVFKVMDNM